MAAQRGQCEAEPASDWTDVAGVNIFSYLGSRILHPPRRLSVLQKRVIGADGKLLKCPEGSSSSVLLKKERSECYLTHRCLEGSKFPSGFSVLLCLHRCLGLCVGSIHSLWCPSVQNWKECPKSNGVELSSWHRSPCSPCRLRLCASLISGLLSLIICSGHWFLTCLLRRVLIIQCFGTDISFFLNLNVPCSCFCLSHSVGCNTCKQALTTHFRCSARAVPVQWAPELALCDSPRPAHQKGS